MPQTILILVLAVGWTLTGVLFVFRIRGLRESNEYLEDAREDLIQATLDAERRTGIAETESQYMKITLANLIQRPAVAVMTDENIQQLAALVESMIKPVSKLN